MSAVGLDLLEIGRLEQALERRPRLAERLFTAREREYAAARSRPGQHLAARFCAKEAVAKALALEAWSWRDIEVVSPAAGGPPRIVLHGELAARGVRALALGEEPERQPGPPFERPLQAVDLEQVQADAHAPSLACSGVVARGRYSTVTVLARLRGWSTFSPRSRAIL